MTQVEAAADASAESAKTDRGRLVQLIVAAVLMGAAGVMLVATGVWALTFKGVTSRELVALDLPHPSNLAAEGRRIFYTFAGIAIAIVVMGLASLLQKHKAPAAAPQEATTSTGKAPAN